MPRSGGVFTLVPGYFATDGTAIEVSQHNPPLEDIAQALTDSLPRDGSAPMTGNLPMGGNKITGLAAGTNPSDAARFDQVASSAFLISVSALSLLANEMVYANGVNTAAKTALTPFARTLLDDADATAVRTTIGAQATITTLPLANGGTGAALVDPGADRIMFWDDSAGATAYLTPGTGLTIAGTTITAQAGRVLLASKTASASSTLDFTEFDNATYRYYEFVFENVIPTTDIQALLMRFSTNGGSSYDAGASDYQWTGEGRQNGGSVATSGTGTSCQLASTNFMGNAAGEFGLTGKITLYHAGNASARTRYEGGVSYDTDSSQLVTAQIGGLRNATQDTDAVRFLMTAGTIASGTIRMYGIAE